MARFIKTNHDPEGKVLRIEAGLRAADGKYYLVLHRLPPEYAKPPTFVVELTNQRMDVRSFDGSDAVFYKAFAIQDFTPKELGYLKGLKEGGTHAPFFNFSYPTVLRILGKTVYRLTDAEVVQLTGPHNWKLIGSR